MAPTDSAEKALRDVEMVTKGKKKPQRKKSSKKYANASEDTTEMMLMLWNY